MKKSEIERSYHNGSEGEPMVNVKVYALFDRALAEQVERDAGYAGFAEWYTNDHARESAVESAFDFACMTGWEDAEDVACSAFGDGVTVFAAGRSSGWLYVTGLPDVETWDAIQVSRWSLFANDIHALVETIPYRTLAALADNEYGRECQEFADAEFLAENVNADAMRDLLAKVGG